MIVVDAGVVVTLITDDVEEGELVRDRIAGELMTAPELIDLEVGSALRRLTHHGEVTEARAIQAVADLVDLPMERVRHAPLLWRCWELRANLTVYDAVYVALAESQGVSLLTGDRRLAAAPGPRCEIEVL